MVRLVRDERVDSQTMITGTGNLTWCNSPHLLHTP
jgi:hypothetical protein